MTVFSTHMTGISTGTGVNETSPTSVNVPANAVELVSMHIDVTSTQANPAESIIGIGKLTGDNWLNNPYEVAVEIGSSKLGAVSQSGYYTNSSLRPWKANLPVTKNSTISFTYQPMDALANNGLCQATFRWSTEPSGLPPRKRKFTRAISTDTTSNSDITLTDLKSVTEVIFGVTATTVSADDPGNYSLSLESSSLKEQQTVQAGTIISSIEATSGIGLTSLTREPQSILTLPGTSQATFSANLTATSGLSTAGIWFYGIEYIPSRVQ